MKRLYIALICIMPLTGFAQTTIKNMQLPELRVNFVTKLRTFSVDQSEPGAKKDKLTGVLDKWFKSKYTFLKSANAAQDTSATVMNGEGAFFGSCPIEHQQYDMNATDRVPKPPSIIKYALK